LGSFHVFRADHVAALAQAAIGFVDGDAGEPGEDACVASECGAIVALFDDRRSPGG
jgi:hypothetical protein